MAETTFIYDLRGLKCPLVLLKTRKKKAELSPEITLLIVSDDPLAPLDIANYCQKHDYTFEKRFENGIYHLSIGSKKPV